MVELTMLTVGVPSKGITNSLVFTIQRILQSPAVEKIVVSINPAEINHCSRGKLPTSSRVEYIFQEIDLGLYGNFRFLLNRKSRLSEKS